MLQTTAQGSFSAKSSKSNHPPVKQAYSGAREYLRPHEVEELNDRYVQKNEKTDELISITRGEQATPPSNKRRKQEEGTEYIECKPIKRSGKKYKQYWYHYEK